jgi:hypothetical protein|tara:strand:+ start:328 stop:702 length:375 start_codon:yes stop_codon:yes gene_type:complete
MEKLNQIFQELGGIKGLKSIAFLDSNMKEIVNKLEEENNQGVLESVKKDYTLLLSHDSCFRKPVSEVVSYKDGTVMLPPVDFPEVNAREVVSSSPSLKVHDALLKELNISLDAEEATLLIGFNL